MTRKELTTKLNAQLKILADAEALVATIKAEVAAKEALIADMDTTTEPTPEAAPVSFDNALEAFVSAAQAIVDEHYNTSFPTLSAPILTTKAGRRYVKVIRNETYGDGCSVYCFVDKTNGDVLKAASWKAPAKHARGNIYRANNGTDGVTCYGGRYL